MSLQLTTENFSHISGYVEYIHNDSIGDVCAFLTDEDARIRLHIPRMLGVTDLSVEIYNESLSRILFTCNTTWSGAEGKLDLYELSLADAAVDIGLYFYRLKLTTAYGVIFGYKNGGKIKFESKHQGDYFQISLSDFKYKAPSKRADGIMYHIFVDRFNRGGRVKNKKGTVRVDDWSNGIPEYPAYPGAPLKNNTFYGGTIYGIIEKLDYIASLGTKLIYLSPIFDAASNHKYDTADYMKVDEMFGGDKALAMLIDEAKKRDIGIILDGVFNHTGSDSRYFNRYGNYDTVGAYQSKESEFYSWYDFQSHPNKYTCWWGIDILPRINPNIPACRNYFIGEGGVIEKYARMGVDGFRLDVADELSDDFIAGIKARLNETNKESILYGEVWEDASNKIAYDKRKTYYLGSELDGVMNYPIRTGIIKYFTEGSTDALHYALTDIINNAPKRIRDMQMNLLGTHDTERIITVLGGESSRGRSNDYLCRKRMTADELSRARARLKMAYTVLATVPGIPVIFYGDEVGLQGYHDPFNRMPYPWGKEDVELLEFYRLIGSLRTSSNIYSDGEFKLIELDPQRIVFARYNKRKALITVINNSREDITVELSNASKFLISNKKSRQNAISAYSSEIIETAADADFTIF